MGSQDTMVGFMLSGIVDAPSHIDLSVSEHDAHRGNNDDRSVGAFAVKPRAFGAPLCVPRSWPRRGQNSLPR
jgi:hypothetical protein